MEIKWKGVSSNTKVGLIILSLPPITKPQMRVNETVVDGRDGSFIEELGYQAYDKTIKIGLKGNYNIDDIISYFSGSGELVMDNEPDKVYDAMIIGQIDYQRLLRFRTADIKFRVQPFKHKLNEAEQTITSGGIVTNAGNIISKPIITIEGSGTVELSLEGIAQFTYEFPEGENKVVIDCEKEDAYLGNVLKNRNMTGEFPKLAVGSNTITYTGTVTSLKVHPKSRWI